jgi:hypothetical protein
MNIPVPYEWGTSQLIMAWWNLNLKRTEFLLWPHYMC